MKSAIFFSLFLSMMAPSFAGDVTKGATLYKKKGCKQCHKADGSGKAKLIAGKFKVSGTKGPAISGLSVAYIVQQITAIQGKDKATRRKTRFTTGMKAKVRRLKPEQISDLAAYIHSLAKSSRKGMLE